MEEAHLKYLEAAQVDINGNQEEANYLNRPSQDCDDAHKMYEDFLKEKSIMEKRVGYVCRKVIDRIDKDGDGTVSVREAVNAMRGSWKDW